MDNELDNEMDMELDLFVQHSIYLMLKKSGMLIVESEVDLLTDFDNMSYIEIYDYKGHHILTIYRDKRDYLIDGVVHRKIGSPITTYTRVSDVATFKCVIDKFINTLENNLKDIIIELRTLDELEYYLLQIRR